jgi:hypothetical protein
LLAEAFDGSAMVDCNVVELEELEAMDSTVKADLHLPSKSHITASGPRPRHRAPHVQPIVQTVPGWTSSIAPDAAGGGMSTREWNVDDNGVMQVIFMLEKEADVALTKRRLQRRANILDTLVLASSVATVQADELEYTYTKPWEGEAVGVAEPVCEGVEDRLAMVGVMELDGVMEGVRVGVPVVVMDNVAEAVMEAVRLKEIDTEDVGVWVELLVSDGVLELEGVNVAVMEPLGVIDPVRLSVDVSVAVRVMVAVVVPVPEPLLETDAVADSEPVALRDSLIDNDDVAVGECEGDTDEDTLIVRVGVCDGVVVLVTLLLGVHDAVIEALAVLLAEGVHVAVQLELCVPVAEILMLLDIDPLNVGDNVAVSLADTVLVPLLVLEAEGDLVVVTVSDEVSVPVDVTDPVLETVTVLLAVIVAEVEPDWVAELVTVTEDEVEGLSVRVTD